jgi:hypothetical protein
MAHGADPAELFDIQVDELAWLLAFIGRIGSAGSRAVSLFKPSRRKTRLTVAAETAVSAAICLPVQRWRRSRSISSITA